MHRWYATLPASTRPSTNLSGGGMRQARSIGLSEFAAPSTRYRCRNDSPRHEGFPHHQSPHTTVSTARRAALPYQNVENTHTCGLKHLTLSCLRSSSVSCSNLTGHPAAFAADCRCLGLRFCGEVSWTAQTCDLAVLSLCSGRFGMLLGARVQLEWQELEM